MIDQRRDVREGQLSIFAAIAVSGESAGKLTTAAASVAGTWCWRVKRLPEFITIGGSSPRHISGLRSIVDKIDRRSAERLRIVQTDVAAAHPDVVAHLMERYQELLADAPPEAKPKTK